MLERNLNISNAEASLTRMETISVRCNHCGAPLELAEKTRFVTCQFCHSHLEVKRTESSIFTEEVAKIAESTSKMADSLEVITLQNELERLDREHAPERAMQAAKNLPNGAKAFAGCIPAVMLVMFTAFGIFFATTSSQMGAPGIFPLFGGGFALIGVIGLFGIIKHLVSPNESLPNGTAYQQQRAELVRKIEELTKG